VWGGGAAYTSQFMYWSCHNTIRTQILNWSQSCRNHKLEPLSSFNVAKKPQVYARFGLLGGSWPGPGLTPGNLEPLLTSCPMSHCSHTLHRSHYSKSLVMGADRQSLQHLFYPVPQLTEILFLILLFYFIRTLLKSLTITPWSFI